MNLFHYKTVNVNRKIIMVKMFQKCLAVINSRIKILELNIVSKYLENDLADKHWAKKHRTEIVAYYSNN